MTNGTAWGEEGWAVTLGGERASPPRGWESANVGAYGLGESENRLLCAAKSGTVFATSPFIIRMSNRLKQRIWSSVWSGCSNEVHWWLRKNTVFIDGSHITSSPRSCMTWWGSSLASLMNELTGTSHMGYFMSTAVLTEFLRGRNVSRVEPSVNPTLDEEAPMGRGCERTVGSRRHRGED